jgi:hypothetical protein
MWRSLAGVVTNGLQLSPVERTAKFSKTTLEEVTYGREINRWMDNLGKGEMLIDSDKSTT